MKYERQPQLSLREQRVHPRFELFAHVRINTGNSSLTLPVTNISLGGILVDTSVNESCAFGIGESYKLVIFDPIDGQNQLEVEAKLVRRQQNGIAFMWSDNETIAEVAALLAVLRPR